jgi:hypothetical protein
VVVDAQVDVGLDSKSVKGVIEASKKAAPELPLLALTRTATGLRPSHLCLRARGSGAHLRWADKTPWRDMQKVSTGVTLLQRSTRGFVVSSISRMF